MPAKNETTIEELRRVVHNIDNNPDYNPDAENSNGIPQQTINVIDLANGEKLILFEGYCRRCETATVMTYSSLTRRYICTGCGRRTPSQTLMGRLWDKLAHLVK